MAEAETAEVAPVAPVDDLEAVSVACRGSPVAWAAPVGTRAAVPEERLGLAAA